MCDRCVLLHEPLSWFQFHLRDRGSTFAIAERRHISARASLSHGRRVSRLGRMLQKSQAVPSAGALFVNMRVYCEKHENFSLGFEVARRGRRYHAPRVGCPVSDDLSQDPSCPPLVSATVAGVLRALYVVGCQGCARRSEGAYACACACAYVSIWWTLDWTRTNFGGVFPSSSGYPSE